MSGSARGIGILVEYFSDFLQRLFEGNGVQKLSEKNIQKSLKIQGNLTIDELINKPWGSLISDLDKTDTKTLDQIVQFIYEKLIKEPSESDAKLKNRILELIGYLDSERSNFSLDRNSIKNSLLQQI